MPKNFKFKLKNPPEKWKRLGIILHHGAPGEFDSSVIGDPNIVWDEKEEPAMREPAPSHGRFVYTPEEWSVTGWKAFDQPIEWIDDIPKGARQNGEGTYFWKHQILVQPDRTMTMYYHSGSYGEERLFGRRAKAV